MLIREWGSLFASLLTALGLLSWSSLKQAREAYIETFDHGHGGWIADRYSALKVWDGVAYCHSPWWVDANHAPPGAGYLHMVLWQWTDSKWYQIDDDYTRKLPYKASSFAEQRKSRDFTNARLTVRIRGDIDLKSAELVFLIHAARAKNATAYVLTGQPFKISRDWSEQTVRLEPDPKQWKCLGARHDMKDEYVCEDLASVLRDVSSNMMFVLFPIQVVPVGGGVEDVHRLRAAKDYPVDPEYLPKGIILFDTIQIQYP